MSVITVPYPSEIRPARKRKRYTWLLLFLLAVTALILAAFAWPLKAQPVRHTSVMHSRPVARTTAVVHPHAAKGVTVSVNGTAYSCAIPKPVKRH